MSGGYNGMYSTGASTEPTDNVPELKPKAKINPPPPEKSKHQWYYALREPKNPF